MNIYQAFDIDPKIVDHIKQAEKQILDQTAAIDQVAEVNQMRVLKALQHHRLSDTHFNWNTGYGYNDAGREVIEEIYASIFGADASIVRPLIVNGTHALTLCLTGVLRPGDTMVSITGTPYDTLKEAIGIGVENGSSLKEIGVAYEEVDLHQEGGFDYSAIDQKLESLKGQQVKMIYIQRSAGYSWRSSVSIEDIERVITHVKNQVPEAVVMVDNCYGEFLEVKEPTMVGADIMAGSLIKNPGGGLALSGGYVVGRQDLIDLVAHKLTSPGIGLECGLMFGQSRSILQGLFMAPTVVAGALKGAILCSAVYDGLGYPVCPQPRAGRSDIIQAVKLGSPEKVVAFCKGIQAAAPVDSFVTPEPWAMPGYDSDVIMAAGAFVQGSSIELSADAPIREPYTVYFQGGLTYAHSKFGVMKSLQALVDSDLVHL